MLFVGITGPAGRLPTYHAAVGLIWMALCVWVVVQGLVLTSPEKDVPWLLAKHADHKFGKATCVETQT